MDIFLPTIGTKNIFTTKEQCYIYKEQFLMLVITDGCTYHFYSAANASFNAIFCILLPCLYFSPKFII
jgi:hypothetical protein